VRGTAVGGTAVVGMAAVGGTAVGGIVVGGTAVEGMAAVGDTAAVVRMAEGGTAQKEHIASEWRHKPEAGRRTVQHTAWQGGAETCD